MSGHSKWANIKHRKARIDEKRGKVFTKIGRELVIAVKQGGGDPETNARLKTAIQNARESNMPNENIMRNIQKATGELDGVEYEEIVYEGYGPGGVAVLLNIMTDNRNRTAGEIRYLFSRNGGNLGESGCVAWMFNKKGVISIDLTEGQVDTDALMLQAIEAGAEDVNLDEVVLEIITAPEELEKVKEAMAGTGLDFRQAEVTMLPQNTVPLEDESQARQVLRLMELLEDHDDVQAVYANFDIPDEIINRLEGE